MSCGHDLLDFCVHSLLKLQIQRLQGFEERPLLCKIVCKLEKEKTIYKEKHAAKGMTAHAFKFPIPQWSD